MPGTRLIPRLALIVALMVVVAACSGSDGQDAGIPDSGDLASSTTVLPSTTTTTEPRLSLEEATLEFTSCMRDEGVDIPDIRLGADGRPVLGDLADTIDTQDPTFQAALAACSQILTRAGALDLRSDPELQAVIQDQLQMFAECMRTEGIDFPDPLPGFSGTGSPFPLDQIPLTDPGFQEALAGCQDQLVFPGFGG